MKRNIQKFKSFRVVTSDEKPLKLLCFHGLGGTPNHFWPLYQCLNNNVQLIMVGLDQIEGKTPCPNEILTAITKMYPKNEIKGIIGHSAGTLFALAAMSCYPTAKTVVINPSLLTSYRKLKVSMYLKRLPYLGPKVKSYLDHYFFKKGYSKQKTVFKKKEIQRVSHTKFDQTRHWLIWSKALSKSSHGVSPFLQLSAAKDQLVSLKKQESFFHGIDIVIHPTGSHMLLIEEPEWIKSILQQKNIL